MVYFYGVTLNRLQTSLTEQQLEHYPLWSWLIFRLSEYIYKLEQHPETSYPYIPKEFDETTYGRWFYSILPNLKEAYDDATPERLFKCCENAPAEEVAIIIYDATALNLQEGFMNSISSLPQSEPIETNPANDDLSETDSLPDLIPATDDDLSETDSLPDLIPVTIFHPNFIYC
jgi:hypothetical protein